MLAGAAGTVMLAEPVVWVASAASGALATIAGLEIGRRVPPTTASATVPRPDELLPTASTPRRPIAPPTDPSERRWAVHRRRLAAELETAVGSGALRLAFQPVVALRSCEVVAFEAAFHWQRADGHVALPDELTAIAHETGLIVPMGRWLIEEACRQLARWNDSVPDRAPLTVAVPVSTRLVMTPDLGRHVGDVVERRGIDPECLLLQITETAFTEHGSTFAQLEAVRRIGVRVAIDGYGTGAATLTHLASLPIDALKIDRGFVADLGVLTNDTTVISAFVTLGHALGLDVIAEGVDTDAQLAMLQTLGCDLAQGNYFARPMSATRAAGIVRDRTMHMPGV